MSSPQGLQRSVVALIAMLVAPPAVAFDAQFDVFYQGVRIGVFAQTGAVDPRAYTTSVAFAGTGLVAALAEVRVSMQAAGRVRGEAFLPDLFQEDVTFGARRSDVQMSYEDGTPRLSGGKLGTEEAQSLDPADQTGTVDPATVLLIAARDQPRAGLCRIDQPVFDGARRTRLILDTAQTDGDRVICRGRFLRLGGYSERQLRQGRVVEVTLTYAPGGDTMQLVEARLNSPRGRIDAVRR